MAANPFLGETALTIRDAEYKLVIDPNALCYAEEALQIATDEILALVQDGMKPMRLVRALFWAAAQKHHGGMHLVEAGELIAKAGLPAVREAILKALLNALGADKGEGKEPVDPPLKLAASGTG